METGEGAEKTAAAEQQVATKGTKGGLILYGYPFRVFRGKNFLDAATGRALGSVAKHGNALPASLKLSRRSCRGF
jgi:hypothetical protein